MNPSSPAATRLVAAVQLPRSQVGRFVLACDVIAALNLLATVADSDLHLLGQAVRDVAIGVVAVATLAAASAVYRRPGRGILALAGALSLLLGVFALTAGSITGITGLLIAGPRPGSVLGVLGFAAGLVLVVTATVWLLRSVPKWWRLAGIPGAYLVLQFAIMPVGMAMLATHVPQPAFSTPVPQGAQRVTFAAGDGVSLAGWYTPSKNGATVIVLAGAGSTKADTHAQSAVLTSNGYGVLAFDARGTGESAGHPHLWGWGGDGDLLAAVDYLESLPGVDLRRIAALGESMGAEVAITAAAADGRIRAVVAEGATARVCADLTFLGSDLEGTIHRTDTCLGYALTATTSAATEPRPLRDAFESLGARPVLLIAADLPEEHAATEAWRSLSPATIQLWEPVAAGHTGALNAYPAEWEQRVIAFLDGALALG